MNDPKDNPLIATLDRVPVQAIRVETDYRSDVPNVSVYVLIDSTWRTVFESVAIRSEVQTMYAVELLATPLAPFQGGIYPATPIRGVPIAEGEPEMVMPLPEDLQRMIKEHAAGRVEVFVKPGLEGVTASMVKNTDAGARATERQHVDRIVDAEVERREQAVAGGAIGFVEPPGGTMHPTPVYPASNLADGATTETKASTLLQERVRKLTQGPKTDAEARERDARSVERLKKEQTAVKRKGGRKK